MYLITGLGNMGAEYAHTRHNAGFDTLDILASKLDTRISREKERALIGECFHHGQKLILAQPQTYMNLSGLAVKGLMNWYKIPPENLIVVYDDIDIEQGALRIRKNGSAGTHNGMRSIIAELGYSDFPRVRVGVGERGLGYSLADWVLSKYSPEEWEKAQKAFGLAADAVLEYIDNGIESAMNLYNTKKTRKPKEGDEA